MVPGDPNSPKKVLFVYFRLNRSIIHTLGFLGIGSGTLRANIALGTEDESEAVAYFLYQNGFAEVSLSLVSDKPFDKSVSTKYAWVLYIYIRDIYIYRNGGSIFTQVLVEPREEEPRLPKTAKEAL